MKQEEKKNVGQNDSSLLVATQVAGVGADEEVTAPMDLNDLNGDPFYSRNRRYSRYRAGRGGRNSLM